MLLKLQHYRPVSLAARINKKLYARFFGPFKVLQRVGKVAYKLELPASAKMHHVFHVPFLKRFRGNPDGVPALPPIQHDDFLSIPQAILDSRLSKGQRELLVHWQGIAS